MVDPNRLTVDEFFAWQSLVEGRYELIDGHIVPHPDYFDARGLAAPDTGHARIVANLTALLATQLRPPCRVYTGAGAQVDRVNANIPDVAVSCSEADFDVPALREPRFVFEISSPKTARTDTGRKVGDYLAIATLEAYLFVDRKHGTITVYRPCAGPQTYDSGSVVSLGSGVSLVAKTVFA